MLRTQSFLFIYTFLATLAMMGLGLVLKTSLRLTTAFTTYDPSFFSKATNGLAMGTCLPCKMWWPMIKIGAPLWP